MAHHFTPSLAKCTLTPPSLNRQHSYGFRPDGSRADATSSLANVAARTNSPPRSRKSPLGSPVLTPATSPGATPERRTSWEDCRLQRDGYISFPDFDQLREEREVKAMT